MGGECKIENRYILYHQQLDAGNRASRRQEERDRYSGCPPSQNPYAWSGDLYDESKDYDIRGGSKPSDLHKCNRYVVIYYRDKPTLLFSISRLGSFGYTRSDAPAFVSKAGVELINHIHSFSQEQNNTHCCGDSYHEWLLRQDAFDRFIYDQNYGTYIRPLLGTFAVRKQYILPDNTDLADAVEETIDVNRLFEYIKEVIHPPDDHEVCRSKLIWGLTQEQKDKYIDGNRVSKCKNF